MQMAVPIKIQKFCYHGNVTSHFSLLGSEKISAIKNAKLLGGENVKLYILYFKLYILQMLSF